MDLSAHTSAELDLDALCAEASVLLRRVGPGSADARVRDLPDARTVRYYQTLGLLDRPARYDGRRALYGYRHLLQVVSVKLLQARGLTLAQAQQALAVASTAQLESAVREALGEPSDAAAPAPLEPLAASGWTTVELAPGVLALVDARLHPPQTTPALIERLRAAANAAPLSPPSRGARP